MKESEIIKKKKPRKRSSEKLGPTFHKKTWPTLAHIVLSNGSQVDIPKLPGNFSELTTYDNMRIALEFAALSTCCLRELEVASKRRTLWKVLESHRMNLEDLMNHLYYAIEGYPKEKGWS